LTGDPSQIIVPYDTSMLGHRDAVKANRTSAVEYLLDG